MSPTATTTRPRVRLLNPRARANATLAKLFSRAYGSLTSAVIKQLDAQPTHVLLFADGGYVFFRGSVTRDSYERFVHIEFKQLLGTVGGPASQDERAALFIVGATLDPTTLKQRVPAAQQGFELVSFLADVPEHVTYEQKAPSEPSRLAFLTDLYLSEQVEAHLGSAGSLAEAARALLAQDVLNGSPATSVHIYFSIACQQRCEFCELPLLRSEQYRGLPVLQVQDKTDIVATGVFAEFLKALHELPIPPIVTISGHDWLQHPSLDAMLTALERYPLPRLRLLGPSTKLADVELAKRVGALPGLDSLTTTIESCIPEVHDAIVGAPGAHAMLMQALTNLEHVPWLLALVITRRSLETLPQTLRWIRDHNHTLQLTTFIPDKGVGERQDHVLAPVRDTYAALERCEPDTFDSLTSIIGVPPCGVPKHLRRKLSPPHVAPERDALMFAPECDACSMRQQCSGVPSRYLATIKDHGLIAISDSDAAQSSSNQTGDLSPSAPL